MADFLEDDLPIVDRTRLEHYATCPAQGWHVDQMRKHAVGFAAESGRAVHDAISRVVGEWIGCRGGMDLPDITFALEHSASGSRPDVQSDVMAAVRPFMWSFARWLKDTHPTQIVRYDGGEGDRSGQLAWELDGVLVTSEVDMLKSTASPDTLEDWDWKSGRKWWTTTDVATSFQFQLHAWLLLNNYSDLNRVDLRVWNPRFNTKTDPVPFTRKNFYQLEDRVASAVQVFKKYNDSTIHPPTWPTTEKCCICDGVLKCEGASEENKTISDDPGRFVDNMVRTTEQLKLMKKLAGQYVDLHGELAGTHSGMVFGRDKPKSRKPTLELYKP